MVGLHKDVYKNRQKDFSFCRFCDIMTWVMNMEDLKKRKTPRHESFDYNNVGTYFITICTQNRRCILSRIVGTGVLDCPQTELTKYGKIADKYIKQLNEFYNHLSVEEYVIMPNHIHLLLWVKENNNAIKNGRTRILVPTNIERSNAACSQFVSTFKRFCNKEYGENIWQARFYDHIIRNCDDYDKHVKYIDENPIRWNYDELYAEE